MAFEPIMNVRGGAPWVAKPSVRASFQKDRVIVMSLSRPVLDQMNWNTGDRILVQCGYGDDLGKFIMRKVRCGGQKLCSSASKNWFSVSFTVHPMIGQHTREELFEALRYSGKMATFHEDNGDLVVSMPANVAKPMLEVVK